MRQRLEKLFEKTRADAIMIMNTEVRDSNFSYLTGFTSGLFEGDALIATRKGLTLLTSVLEYDTAMKMRPNGMKVIKVRKGSDYQSNFKKYLRNKIVGINGDFLPYAYYTWLKKNVKAKRIIDIRQDLARCRVVKDNEEIARIRKAVGITKRSIRELQKYFKVGVTEEELAAKFDYLIMKHGASEPSFESIVSFGANAALPHHMPDGTRLKPNSFLLVDVGAKYKNYCADITRTFIFRPDLKSEKYKRMRRMYDTVKEAQRLALREIRPGRMGGAAHTTAEDFINKANGGEFRGKFTHSLGHSIGIDVHDGGIGLSPRMKLKIKEGMIFSDEPGIYIVGFGGVRIEDDVVVTKRGGVFL